MFFNIRNLYLSLILTSYISSNNNTEICSFLIIAPVIFVVKMVITLNAITEIYYVKKEKIILQVNLELIKIIT